MSARKDVGGTFGIYLKHHVQTAAIDEQPAWIPTDNRTGLRRHQARPVSRRRRHETGLTSTTRGRPGYGWRQLISFFTPRPRTPIHRRRRRFDNKPLPDQNHTQISVRTRPIPEHSISDGGYDDGRPLLPPPPKFIIRKGIAVTWLIRQELLWLNCLCAFECWTSIISAT